MIRYAEEREFDIIRKHDRHISEKELKEAIQAKRVLVMCQNDCFVGWLRFNLFWDEIPFMNMLYLLEEYSIFINGICWRNTGGRDTADGWLISGKRKWRTADIKWF